MVGDTKLKSSTKKSSNSSSFSKKFTSDTVYLSAHDILSKTLQMAVTMTPKTHHDENFLPVLVYWHQISQNEQSIYHRVHEVAQDRLSAASDST
jgi:hypothetical protein